MEQNKTKYILIGLKQYSTIEYEEEGFRLLFDNEYAMKLRGYLNFWGLDGSAVIEDIIKDCRCLIEGEYKKRNDLPTTFSASTRFGTTTNLLNDIKIQFTEDTLFGKKYNSDIYVIDVEKEQPVHFWI